MPFDYATATPEEIRREAERRQQARNGGALPPSAASDRAAEPLLVMFFVPWSLLVFDNDRTIPQTRRRKDGRTYAVHVLTPKYRDGKRGIRAIAKSAMRDSPPLSGPVRFHAALSEPNRSRTRDIGNMHKILTDALAGVVYLDDGQIDDEHYVRRPVNVDRPGLQVTVTPLLDRM